MLTMRKLAQSLKVPENTPNQVPRFFRELLDEEPVGFAAGDANLMRYCVNDPENMTDPNGLFGEPLDDKKFGYTLKIVDTNKDKSSAQQGNEGAFFWSVNFNLKSDNNKTGSGYIFQEVTITWDINYADIGGRVEYKGGKLDKDQIPPGWTKAGLKNPKWVETFPVNDLKPFQSVVGKISHDKLQLFNINVDAALKYSDFFSLTPPFPGNKKATGNVIVTGRAWFVGGITDAMLKDSQLFQKDGKDVGTGSLAIKSMPMLSILNDKKTDSDPLQLIELLRDKKSLSGSQFQSAEVTRTIKIFFNSTTPALDEIKEAKIVDGK